eukprot:TRINITY_DN16318_c0_g1_i1.p1 TRINITY_DN16318_c0_g1~~TRINITY_DN16318_c0_g1_i1.p1  ORF type:complete len:448 (+),score=74.26 TRINITY_DN16318_c0_g1_i1:27-1370(+)
MSLIRIVQACLGLLFILATTFIPTNCFLQVEREPNEQPLNLTHPTTDRELLYHSFFSWLAQNGVNTSQLDDDLEIYYHPYRGYGARAKRHIQTYDLLMNIPESVIINWKTIRRHAPGLFTLIHPFIGKDHINPLVIFLMHEKIKRNNSFFLPYFRVLSDPVPWVGDFAHEELELFEDPELIQSLNETRTNMESGYVEVVLQIFTRYPDVFPLEKYNFELFKWAFLVFETRAFNVPAFISQDKCSASICADGLLPMVDMINHNSIKRLELRHDMSLLNNRISFLHETDTLPGEEVFIMYNPHDNRDLLAQYFILLNDNPYDFYSINGSHARVQRQLTPWRVATAMAQHCSWLKNDLTNMRPIQLELCRSLVIEELRNELTRYKTSLAEDREALKGIDSGLETNKWIAGAYRIEAKELLEESIATISGYSAQSLRERYELVYQLTNKQD